MPKKLNKSDQFATSIIQWQREFGRHDLPWQDPITPYGVWVSEIMLQQTQVTTVLSYYRRFMERFPSVTTLAKAPQDDVLHLWSGLGYYARGRNLHKAAQVVHQEHGGELPNDFEALLALPGIGRSTAGAILSLAFQNPHPILDGNVKRVLARTHCVDGWPGQTAVANTLWGLAETVTPSEEIRAFTQGMMDLGATLCTRSSPGCSDCPVITLCDGKGEPERYPGKKPKKNKPERQTRFLLIRDSNDRVLLEQRPSHGIWGGLWSFPELPDGNEPEQWCSTRLGLKIDSVESWAPLRHTFTHFHLDITPISVQLSGSSHQVNDANSSLWYDLSEPKSVGLAAPVQKLLRILKNARLF
ncbi:MAG: A/G-specific adenine glycosylase [Pseudomonadota bacterium]